MSRSCPRCARPRTSRRLPAARHRALVRWRASSTCRARRRASLHRGGAGPATRPRCARVLVSSSAPRLPIAPRGAWRARSSVRRDAPGRARANWPRRRGRAAAGACRSRCRRGRRRIWSARRPGGARWRRNASVGPTGLSPAMRGSQASPGRARAAISAWSSNVGRGLVLRDKVSGARFEAAGARARRALRAEHPAAQLMPLPRR